MNSLVKEYNTFYQENPNKWASDSHDKQVFDTVSFFNPKEILDIGCGIGHTITYFQNRWPSCNYTGIDLSNVAIDICSSKIKNAEFYAVDIEYFKPSKKFDLILLVGVGEHFINLISSFKKIYNLLDNKGILFVEIPNCIEYPTSNGKEGFKRVLQGSGQIEWHLFRETWEGIFTDKINFVIKDKIEGQHKWNQFQWILTK